MATQRATIYVHPGENRCNVYLLPYPMRPGQSPRDIAWEYQKDWLPVALLDHNLKLVWIDASVRHVADDIAGQMGGTFFEIDLLEPAGDYRNA